MRMRFPRMSRQRVATTESPARPSTPGNGALKPKALMSCMSAPRPPSSHSAPLALEWWARSSTCGRTTTSDPRRLRCTWRATTISPSQTQVSGEYLRSSSSTPLPSSQRYKRADRKWKRYERQLPGHQIHIDVTFVDALAGSGRGKKFYRFTAIDDCTRLRVARLYPHCDMKTAIGF